MTCAACQATVQRALSRAPGVTNATVNLMTNEATVLYDPAGTDPAQLVSAINETGYVSHMPAAESSAAGEDEAREQAQAREYAVLLTKSVVSVILGALAMIASMPLMGVSGHFAFVGAASHASDPFIAWAMRVLDPPIRRLLPWLYAIDPATLLFVLLGSTTFVMAWAGRHFYVGAWKSLRHGSANMNTLIAIGTGAAFAYSVAATVAPELFVDERRPRRCVLRSGDHHHRARAARSTPWKRARSGTRRGHCASWPGCSRRPRGCGATTRTLMFRSPTCAAASW